MPATVAGLRQSYDSEQISPATIAHRTVYENTRNLQQNYVCQWSAQLYLLDPLSRLVSKSSVEPSLSNNVLPLSTAAYGPNGAISLTQTLSRISFYIYNGQYFWVQKAKNGDRRRIMFTAALNVLSMYNVVHISLLKDSSVVICLVIFVISTKVCLST